MQTVPVFKDATPREIRTMRFWIGANIAVILFCAFWLACYFTLAALSWPYLMAALLAGYFLADFSSGAVHWAMDTWFDERTMGRAIAITREHHTHPDHVYGFLENASFGSAAAAPRLESAIIRVDRMYKGNRFSQNCNVNGGV